MSGPPRILVAEAGDAGDWLIARALRSALEPLEVEQVDGWQGLIARVAQPWSAVVIDCELPGFDLTQAGHLLRAVGVDVPVILVSWGLGEGSAVAAMKAGASDCVLKSELERLAPAVGEALREAAERRALRHAEDLMRTSQLRFRSLLTSTHEVVFTLDWDQRLTSALGTHPGPGLERPATIPGRSPREIFGIDATRVHAEATERALAGESVVYEWTDSRPWGVRTFQTSLCAVMSASGEVTGLVGVSREISRVKMGQPAGALAAGPSAGSPVALGGRAELSPRVARVIAGLEAVRSTALGLDVPPDGRLDPTDPLKDAAEGIRRIVLELKTFVRPQKEIRGGWRPQGTLDNGTHR